ncbi:MAG: hypothetical protein ACPGTQ_15965 [Colwellia sp.]
MSRFVVCQNKQVWKFGADADGTIDGLFQIPEITGIGEHHFCLPSTDNSEWTPVNPMNEPYEGEVLIIRESDVESLNHYIQSNTPKLSFIKRFVGKKQKSSDLINILKSIVEHTGKNGKSEFISWL